MSRTHEQDVGRLVITSMVNNLNALPFKGSTDLVSHPTVAVVTHTAAPHLDFHEWASSFFAASTLEASFFGRILPVSISLLVVA